MDVFAQAILDQIDSSRVSCSRSQKPGIDYQQFECHNGLLFFKKILYVPYGSCGLRIIQNCHDIYTIGHFRSTKTLDLVQRSFWWPRMRRFVEVFLRSGSRLWKARVARSRRNWR